MKKNALCLAVMCLQFAYYSIAGTPITLKDAIGGSYQPDAMSAVKVLPDGESYAQLSDDKKSVYKHSFKTGGQIGPLVDVNTIKGVTINKIDDYIVSPDGRRILLQTATEKIYRRSKKANYYIFDVQNNTAVPLSQNGKQQEPVFSPDGNQIAFVREGNIYLVKLLFGNAESQVTTDGKVGEILNGVPDWVNEEEFTTSRSLDFSADSKMLAWVKYDEREVPMYTLPYYKGSHPELAEYADYPGFYSYKYPKTGKQNALISVHSYDIKSHVIRKLDLPLPADGYIPRIEFTNVPDQLAVLTLNRHQSQMNVYMCNTRSLICKSVLEEKDEKYVKEDAYEQFRLLGDHFVVVSDKGGQRQVYWYTLTGAGAKQLTTGNEVKRFYGYNNETGTFYYQAYDNDPMRTAIFCTNLKGATRKLTNLSGSNAAIFSGNMKYFINTYSNITTPPVVSIVDNQGKTLKTLITNDQLKNRLKGIDQSQREFFSMQTSDGIQLNGWMMKPADFNASKKYPVILYQYSGPGSQEVLDDWGTGFSTGGMYENYLCSHGFIVACVDGRGTGGRGSEFEKCTYLHLGYLESHDQVEAALYLGNLPYVDKSNIGIWGWSYGGFNTLMSMSEGRPVFKAGVSVAPLTSMRYYDTVYTERYMRTPGENADGYDYSPIKRIDKLSGRLLICHGLADDNVHFQNTAEYAEALVQANKQFEMQVYTNRNHSIYGGNTRLHLMTRITEFFVSQLK